MSDSASISAVLPGAVAGCNAHYSLPEHWGPTASLNRVCDGDGAVKHDVLPAQTDEGVKNYTNSDLLSYVIGTALFSHVGKRRIFLHTSKKIVLPLARHLFCEFRS